MKRTLAGRFNILGNYKCLGSPTGFNLYTRGLKYINLVYGESVSQSNN